MRRPAIRLPRWLVRNPALEWALLFLAIQCVVNVDGFINAYSRWATMAAMAEDGTFSIDHYVQHTIDWSRTPDGRYFSNKAPGPALLGYPLFRVMDRVITSGIADRAQRDDLRVRHRNQVLHVLSVVTQALPFALLTLLVVAALQEQGSPPPALHFVAVALLFGNTAALFMNTYFGHAMGAMFVLALMLALHRRWPVRAGLFFGLAVLSDYGAALLVVPLGFVIVRKWRARALDLALVASGGVLPAIAWIAYHTRCFGSPLALPNKFQNPAFVDVDAQTPNLWGVLRLLPNSDALTELLFGTRRGLALTQGWVFFCVAALPLVLWRRRATAEAMAPARADFARWTLTFAVTSLVLLLWMNTSFGGWHGGATPGPRYLAVGFPALAVAAGAAFERLPAFARQAMVVALAMSVLLFVLFFSACEMLAQPDQDLVAFYLNTTWSSAARLQRMMFILPGFAWAGWRAWQSARAGRS